MRPSVRRFIIAGLLLSVLLILLNCLPEHNNSGTLKTLCHYARHPAELILLTPKYQAFFNYRPTPAETNIYNSLIQELANYTQHIPSDKPSLIQTAVDNYSIITNYTQVEIITNTPTQYRQRHRSIDNPRYQEIIYLHPAHSYGDFSDALQLHISLRQDDTFILNSLILYRYPATNTLLTADTPSRAIYHFYKPAGENALRITEAIYLSTSGIPNRLGIYPRRPPFNPNRTEAEQTAARNANYPIELYIRQPDATPTPITPKEYRRFQRERTSRGRFAYWLDRQLGRAPSGRLTTETTPDGHTIRTYRDKNLILETTTDGTSTTHTYILPDGYTFAETDADGDHHYEIITIRHNGQPLQTYTRRPNHSLIPTDLYPTHNNP